MKRLLSALLAVLLLASLLAACTGDASQNGTEAPAPTEEAAPADTPAPTEEAAPADTPAPTEEAAPTDTPAPTEEAALTVLPEPGVIEGGEYRQPFFGIGFPTEDWDEPLTRDQVGMQYYGIPDYGSYTVEDLLLTIGKPYVDMNIARGDTTVTIMLECPPLGHMDGSISNTTAEYMDGNCRTIPATYVQYGVTDTTAERFQTELCGRSFEGCHINVESLGLYQTMLATEKDGVFFTIFITCMGRDENEAVLAAFFPLD